MRIEIRIAKMGPIKEEFWASYSWVSISVPNFSCWAHLENPFEIEKCFIKTDLGGVNE